MAVHFNQKTVANLLDYNEPLKNFGMINRKCHRFGNTFHFQEIITNIYINNFTPKTLSQNQKIVIG